MSRSHTHRSRRRRSREDLVTVPRSGDVIACPCEAYALFDLVRSEPATDETLVLMLDADHRGHMLVAVDHASSAQQVSEVLEAMIHLHEAVGSSLSAVVFGTVRVDGNGIATLDDEFAWGQMRVRADQTGLELIDWLIIDPRGDASSLSACTASTWLWTNEQHLG